MRNRDLLITKEGLKEIVRVPCKYNGRNGVPHVRIPINKAKNNQRCAKCGTERRYHVAGMNLFTHQPCEFKERES